MERSIQDDRFPDGNCFGCGPVNTGGLQIKSFARADGSVVGHWSPRPEHSNGGGFVCGGILGTVLDCHGAAAAAHVLPRAAVTKTFSVEFVRPTPMQRLELEARVVERRSRSAEVEAIASVAGETCVRFRGVFVMPRVEEGTSA